MSNPPLLKRLGAYDRGQWLRWEVGDLGMLFTDFAFFDQFRGVFENSGPIIPLPQGFSCQGLSFDMVATNAFMHLFKYVVGIFFSYALEEGCRKTSFIKVPRKRVNLADLALSLDAPFGFLGSVPFKR